MPSIFFKISSKYKKRYAYTKLCNSLKKGTQKQNDSIFNLTLIQYHQNTLYSLYQYHFSPLILLTKI